MDLWLSYSYKLEYTLHTDAMHASHVCNGLMFEDILYNTTN